MKQGKLRSAIFVHGFNVWDGGKSTIDRLKFYFEDQFDCSQYDYGWTGLLGVRFCHAARARAIAGMVKDGHIGVGHSNGCTLLYRASFLNTKIKHLILINPALDHDSVFPEHLETITVYHTKKDEATKWAKFLPFSIWGDMGNLGATADDPRITNIDEKAQYGVTTHSGVFSDSYAMAGIKSRFLKTLLLNNT